MDYKTMQKVINGQEDKIEVLEKKLDNMLMLEQEQNRKIYAKIDDKIYSKIAVDDKISSLKMINIQELDDKIEELEQKANRTGQFHLDAINEKLSKLEKKVNDTKSLVYYDKDNCVSNNDYKKLWQENTDDYNELARKRLGDYEKIEDLEKSLDIAFKESANDYDNLESKYYKLRSELDSIYKVLEMDALDIQALQDKTFNGVTRDNSKACAEYEAEQMLIDENNRLNDEHLTNKGGE